MVMQAEHWLSRILEAILLCLLVMLLSACSRGVGRCAGDVTEVTYHHWTGHVVPSWSENYVLSGTSVRLTRTGEPGSEINAGKWEFDVDPQDVALLFAQLKAVKWASIKAIPPGELLVDGGASISYEVTCERGTGAYLSYREGRTYDGDKAVTDPIDEFIANLALPQDAYRVILADPD
jgi:hypothetical protein